MIFSDKVSHLSSSDSENIKRISDNSSQPMDPFSFSALHFIRNRLMPTGKGLMVISWFGIEKENS